MRYANVIVVVLAGLIILHEPTMAWATDKSTLAKDAAGQRLRFLSPVS